MKKKVRIFSIILSLFLFFFSVWNCTLNVFAFPKFDWSDMSWKEASWEEVEGEVMATLGYVSTSLSAVTDGNFSQFIANYYDFKSLWDESGWLKDQIVVDSNDNTITFSDDLTAYMKQALIEYAEETNGFKLIATTDYHDLSASDFRSGYVYHSFRNIVHENGLVAVTGGGVSGNVCNQSLSFAFFLPFDNLLLLPFLILVFSLILPNSLQYHIQTTYLSLSQILKRLNHQNHILAQSYLNRIHNCL